MLKNLKRTLTYYEKNLELYDDPVQESPTIKFLKDETEEIKREAKLSFFSEDIEEEYNEREAEESSDKYKISERNVIILAVVTSIMIITLVSTVGFYKLTDNISSSNKNSNMESLEGKSLSEAQKIANEYDITVNEISKEYSDTVPKGKIISQDVGEDGNIKNVSTINVVTSLGPEMQKVPNLVNSDVNDAQETLSEYDFKYVEKYDNNDTVPIGVVYDQMPEAGEEVPSDTEIVLYISKGPETVNVTVPSIIGFTDAQAISTLENLGLTVGKSTSEPSDRPEGTVIEQSIQPGTIVKKDTTISYVISEGPEEVPEEVSETVDDSLDAVNTENKQDTTQNPANSTEEVTTTTKKLVVDPVNMPENDGTVNLKITQTIDNETTEFYNDTISVEQFPITFNVTGTGLVEYTTYLENDEGVIILQGTETINFESSN